jgi:hypothetical protein
LMNGQRRYISALVDPSQSRLSWPEGRLSLCCRNMRSSHYSRSTP